MRYVCQICGYVYDDAKEAVPFAELPTTWKCPLCGAAKSDFKPEAEKATPPKTKPAPAAEPQNLENLTAGQLAALCSNLARGCEKQYKPQHAEEFRKLAAYFTAHVPPLEDATVEKLSERLLQDTEAYAGLRAASDEAMDRGAARVCVWGEKVTRMLSSLVKRYLAEGEMLTAGSEIWVCTVCGFVYIGEKPPELCPVCKVPAWKFEKVEGR